jgi:hypothetical protein
MKLRVARLDGRLRLEGDLRHQVLRAALTIPAEKGKDPLNKAELVLDGSAR